MVCRYLQAARTCELERSDVVIDPEQSQPVPAQVCRELLRNEFDANDLNFSLINGLLSVLSGQLLKLSNSKFFRWQELANLVTEDVAPELRKLLFESLKKTATDFATRSVNNSRSEQEVSFSRVTSSQPAVHTTAGGKVHITAAHMLDRVKSMIRWDDSNHLVVQFNSHNSETVTILYRDVTQVGDEIHRLMEPQTCLLHSREDDPLPDLRKLHQHELQSLLERIACSSLQKASGLQDDYALTADNLLKMALVMQRVRAHVPVVIMGETGCGKTSLIRYLANVCSAKFCHFTLHAGLSQGDIVREITSRNDEATSLSNEVWVFLDEVNTCDHLGLLSEVICHRRLSGRKLSRNIVFLAACNPYRERTSTQAMNVGPPSDRGDKVGRS